MLHFLRGCLLLGLVMTAPVLAEEPQAETAPAAKTEAEQTPEDCLRESMQALIAGDYRTYVTSLAFAEQARQAGLVQHLMSQNSRTSNVSEISKPEDVENWLLFSALSDLMQRHRRENSGYGYNPGQPLNEVEFINHLVKLGHQLKSPGEFLIEALAEIHQPIQISGAVQEPRESSLPATMQTTLVQTVEHYRDIPRTFYTRGSRAVAIPIPEALPDAAQPDNSPAATPDKNSRLHSIEFVKVDGTWKIARMFFYEKLQ